MASLTDIIFGTDSEANIDSESLLSEEQRNTLNQLLEALTGEAISAPLTGELSPTQQALQAELDAIIGGGIGATTTEGLKDIIAQGPQDIDRAFTESIQDPLLQDFEENILPRIGRQFGGAFFGSERRDADARAREDLVQTLGRERARFGFEARENDLNRTLQALGLLPATATGFADFAGRADLGESQRRREVEERNELLRLLFGGATTPTLENIATVTPGSTGALTSFLTGLGEGSGRSLGGG